MNKIYLPPEVAEAKSWMQKIYDFVDFTGFKLHGDSLQQSSIQENANSKSAFSFSKFAMAMLMVFLLLSFGQNASAQLAKGDVAFTSYNADEDGWSLVTFVDIPANTTIYFTDNEATGATTFNTGESYHQWNTGTSIIAAGTVVRFRNIDVTTLSASVGTLTRATVASSSNYGISSTADAVYAFLGTSAAAPTLILTAISSGDAVTPGDIFSNAGLAVGTNAIAIRNSADYGEYSGSRSGLTTFAGYKPLVFNVANWTVDLNDGSYATTVPNTTAFTITAACVAPMLSATITDALCAGSTNGAIDLSTSGGSSPFTYLWSNGAVTEDITGVAGGNYSVTVTAAGGCTATANYVVNQPMMLTASAFATGATCGNANGSVDLTVTGGTTPYSYMWSDASVTEDLTNVLPGNYNVIVNDANGCIASVNATVTNTAGPSASATTTNASCGSASGSVDLTVTGGSVPFTYLWSNGATTEDLVNVAAGAYSVTITDANGCTTTANATVGTDADAVLPTITAPPAVAACTNLNCTATGVNLGTPVTADNCTVASVTNNAPAAFPLGATTVTWTVTDAAGNTATATQTVTVTDGTAPSIYITQTGLVPGVTGASSSASPYVLPVKPGVKFTSILTVGDAAGGYKMAGIPDGLGAFDNCDGTFTLLMNHEIGNTLGVVRDHGAKGAFVSSWIINKANLSVVSGGDLMKTVYNWNTTTQKNDTTTPFIFAFSRFCSADLPVASAFYNAATGLGSKAHIFMHGEEGGANGYQLASVASGADKGKSYILGKFNLTTNGSGLTGVGAWENALANPFAQDKTIVIGNNDGGTGIMNNTVSVYVGTKTNTGSEVDKAGLNNGTLKFVEVAGNPLEIPTANATTRATNITSGAAFTLSATSSTTFSRPEDGVWNPANPSQFFFVTTDRLDQVADGTGTQIGRSRLWRLNFTDITNPDLGGTIDLLLDGTEGHNMLDNMTADKTGHLILLEDVGNAAHNGKIWQYTIATDQLTQIAKHDPARFGDIGVPATAPFNIDEETSGVIDVSDILGAGMHLLVDQAHYTVNPPITADLVEGGQLMAMFNPGSLPTTSTAVDTVKTCSGVGVVLGTPATADNCSVASVTNNAPTTFPSGNTTVTWTVTDAAGNTATATQVVSIVPDAVLPTITAPPAVAACTNLNCTATGVNLGTPVTADNCTVASVTNNAPAAFPLGATTVTWTVTDAAGNTATATQTVTVTDGTAPSIYITQTGLVPGVTGASSSASPYVLPVKPGVKFTSILTVGDAAGGYKMAGIPDGLGAFDNCDGTFTLLMNHEIGNTLGVVRDHGAKGAFVSSWIINKANLSVVSGGDLMKTVYNWNTTTQKNDTTTPFIFAFSRFCSADLPVASAFYNAATGLGSKAHIFMHGEEGGANGYQLASVASGADKGKSYILGKFNLTTNGSGLTGVGAWENALANPFAQDKTIVIGNNDGGTGIMNNTVSVYVGTKTNTGSEVDKAGLNNGTLKFVEVAGNPLEIPTANATTRATNITSGAAFTLSATSSTTFSRPEDGVWNPANPSQFFFVTTDRLDQVADGTGTQIGRSRLWRLNFTDITNPDLGGTIDLLLDGTEGHNMLDNMTADKTGHLILLEDVGNAAHNGKIWQYTIATDQLTQIAKHDPARFGDIGVPATAPFNIDEETSGVIDVSDILGAGMHLLVDQAHYTVNPPITADLVEGGQLMAMFNPGSLPTTSTAVDTVKITLPAGTTTATGVTLGTPATADNCSVASVTNNAPSAFPVGTTNVTWTVADAAGNTATATQVVIVTAGVNSLPSVSITSPTAPANFTTNSTIPVLISATDADGTIKKVDIFVNGTLFGTDSTAPYSFTGANVAAGVYKITAKATDNLGGTKETDTLVITVADCTGSGTISGEGFTDIGGSAVVNLTSSPKFINNKPDITATLGSFEYQNVADNYGGRVRGYICAPVTGNYRFWIAADEQATLFLSKDANEANIVPIAYTTAPTGFRQYAKYSSQISALIPLVKGAKYFIQTLHKEATGADHLTVAWQLPNGTFEGPVPGSRLSPYAGTPAPTAGRVTGARSFAIAMESNSAVKEFAVTATPNPSNTYFTLSIKSNLDKTVSVKVLDAAGRLMETKLNAAANSTMQIGDKLLPGIYFVEVLQGNKIQRVKLVKQ